jgi:hypothetical protein
MFISAIYLKKNLTEIRLEILFICEVDLHRKIASKIHPGMYYEFSFGLPEFCPRAELQAQTEWASVIRYASESVEGSELQAQTDCVTVECVDYIIQIQPEWIVSVQWPNFFDKLHPQITVDSPVSGLVGFCQCIA